MKTIISIIFLLIYNLVFPQGIINNNGNVICSGNINFILEDNTDWTNNGTFVADESEVKFKGSSNQYILGSSTTTFYNLSIDKISDDLLIGKNCNISGNLELISGNIDLQNYVIDLLTTGVIVGETETNSIKVGAPLLNTGTIKYTRTVNNVKDFDPANIGVLITTNKNLGEITVTRGHEKQKGVDPYTGNYGIARYYIVPGIGELDSTNNNLVMKYWNSELNEDQPIEENLILYQSVTENSTDFWTGFNATIDINNNQIVPNSTPYNNYVYNNYSNISFNNIFTLGSKETPLPIKLVDFIAQKSESKVKLSWVTYSEINSDIFEIEKSTDSYNWEKIAEKKAAENSNSILNYNDYDYNPSEGLSYYRLKEIDKDGKFEYSKIRSIIFNKNEQINIYPNPSTGLVNVNGTNIKYIEILDLNGKSILKLYDNFQLINLENLKKGTYIIKLISSNSILYQKLVLI